MRSLPHALTLRYCITLVQKKYLLTGTKVQILTAEEVVAASAKPLVLRPIAPALALAAAMSLHARLGAGTLIHSLDGALIEP